MILRCSLLSRSSVRRSLSLSRSRSARAPSLIASSLERQEELVLLLSFSHCVDPLRLLQTRVAGLALNVAPGGVEAREHLILPALSAPFLHVAHHILVELSLHRVGQLACLSVTREASVLVLFQEQRIAPFL